MQSFFYQITTAAIVAKAVIQVTERQLITLSVTAGMSGAGSTDGNNTKGLL